MSIENSFLDKDSMGLRVDCPADAPEPPPRNLTHEFRGGSRPSCMYAVLAKAERGSGDLPSSVINEEMES